MEKFICHEGLVAPLDRANIDTDQIIPKQFLKSIERTGFGPNLFDEWRYLDQGQPGQDNSKRPLNPDFVLNLPCYQGASILLTRRNFGCGSSREHAPWALQGYGFRAILAPSFADIFYNNCFKNGILPVVLPEDEIETLFQAVEKTNGFSLKVDLEAQTITALGMNFHFKVDPAHRQFLLKGLDEIGLTLEHADAIRAYEAKRQQEAPWIFGSLHPQQ